MSEKNWPAWYYGPNGKSGIFANAADVPNGWQDHPSKVSGETKAPTPATQGTTSIASADEGEKAELDASGQPWNADLHSATKSKTNAGLWRMKVGVSRPQAFNL